MLSNALRPSMRPAAHPLQSQVARGHVRQAAATPHPSRTTRGGLVSSGLVIAMREAAQLEADGHAVMGCSIQGGRPSIQVEYSPQLAQMVKHGQAVIYAWGAAPRSGTPWRRGQLVGQRSALVWWEEKGEAAW